MKARWWSYLWHSLIQLLKQLGSARTKNNCTVWKVYSRVSIIMYVEQLESKPVASPSEQFTVIAVGPNTAIFQRPSISSLVDRLLCIWCYANYYLKLPWKIPEKYNNPIQKLKRVYYIIANIHTVFYHGRGLTWKWTIMDVSITVCLIFAHTAFLLCKAVLQKGISIVNYLTQHVNMR